MRNYQVEWMKRYFWNVSILTADVLLKGGAGKGGGLNPKKKKKKKRSITRGRCCLPSPVVNTSTPLIVALFHALYSLGAVAIYLLVAFLALLPLLWGRVSLSIFPTIFAGLFPFDQEEFLLRSVLPRLAQPLPLLVSLIDRLSSINQSLITSWFDSFRLDFNPRVSVGIWLETKSCRIS